MKTHPTFILATVVLMATLLLAGCSQATPTPSPTPEPTPAPTLDIQTPTPAPTTPPTEATQSTKEESTEDKQPDAGQEKDYPVAPDFTAKELFSGKTISLSDYRGQIVFLNFWGSWCPPCRMEMPAFQEVYEMYQDDGVVIIGVGVNDNENSLRSFAQSINITYPIIWDRTSEVARKYRIRSLPTTYRIDQEGYIRGVAVGALTKDQLIAAIEELQKEP